MDFRVIRTGSCACLQIVGSFREQGQVRQRGLSTVGRLDRLQASGPWDTRMRSGLHFCEKLTVIDAHAAGPTEPVQVQRIGPDLVFGRLWENFELGTILKRTGAEIGIAGREEIGMILHEHAERLFRTTLERK